jgi:hypothetical protein
MRSIGYLHDLSEDDLARMDPTTLEQIIAFDASKISKSVCKLKFQDQHGCGF